MTMGGKVDGVLNTDREYWAYISLLFLAYRANVHVSGFVRAWNGTSTFQNWQFTLRHIEYC